MNIAVPAIRLSNGVEMPQLGLGTWPMTNAEAASAVAAALAAGYRMIDTAEAYGNEQGVGQGIRASGVARDEIFLTTKFTRQWHSVPGARQACLASLERLQLDYIDLLLIHWPNPEQDRYVEAFDGMTRLLQEGLVRAIGTSNFKTTHLQRLFERGFCPHVNQIQLDPYHARDDLVALHRQKGIVTETWRPLGAGGRMLQDPVIGEIAGRYRRTPAQIVLRWAIQQGFVTAPKSSQPQRLAENLALFDFTLTPADLAALSALARPDPEMMDADHFGL